MVDETQRARAAGFLDLHHGSGILTLPCAWDAASARLFEEIGFPAVGTSSGAIAHSLGYQDGQGTPVEEVLAAIDRITRAVSVPVSADFEAGYGTTVEEVAHNVRRVIDAGAVGINLEDGTGSRADPLVELDYHAELIEVVRSLADSLDLPFVVNARTDVYLRGVGEDPEDRFDRAVERANAYARAGADCLFLIGVTEPTLIADLVAAIDGPVNVLAFGPDEPSPAELERLGVARVSTGSGPMQASLSVLRQLGERVRETGSYPPTTGEPVTRADLQRWFAPDSE